MPIMHIKIDSPRQAASPRTTELQMSDEEIVEYEAAIAADMGIISGPLLNNQAIPK